MTHVSHACTIMGLLNAHGFFARIFSKKHEQGMRNNCLCRFYREIETGFIGALCYVMVI